MVTVTVRGNDPRYVGFRSQGRSYGFGRLGCPPTLVRILERALNKRTVLGEGVYTRFHVGSLKIVFRALNFQADPLFGYQAGGMFVLILGVHKGEPRL